MDKAQVTKDFENNTLTIERVFDAPKDKLWQAYADKKWFEKWWGPEGWETTTEEFDFSIGGRIHYCMKCVDKNQSEWFGQESWGLMVIDAIDEPNRIEITDHFSNASGDLDTSMPSQKFIVELKEEGEQTRLASHSLLNSTEELEKLISMGMIEGFASQLNRLDEYFSEQKDN